MCASSPPGGSYWKDTRTRVPPSGLGSNRTDPADSTRAPSVRQAISSFGLSLMISASHSNVAPMRPFTTQCDRVPDCTGINFEDRELLVPKSSDSEVYLLRLPHSVP